MTRRMLIEATHPEETRVVVVDGKKLEEFDYESANKRQLKGNIYLAKVTRVEPSLQAAFVEYGGNRHGFLAFSEIHPDYYRIPVADREALLAEHAAMAAADERLGDGEDDLAGNLRADFAADQEAAGGSDGANDDFTRQSPALPLAAHGDQLTGPSGNFEDAGDAPAENGAETDGEASAHIASEAPPVAPATVETVGGDEAEDMRRRRSRPQRRYKIQEVIKRRQIMLVQVTKEERGNKGAALTTYLSLAGRYCVLMPNTGRGGGISRKITSAGDRKRLKSILEDMSIPDGMAVIVRTAGSERNKTELKRDYEYLLRLWDEIRELTLKSTAPTLIYEEASLIKRAIRDLYAREIEEILVEGDEAYKAAKNFMRTLMPSHAKRVQLYKDPAIHLFHRFQIESQLDAIHNPVVHLKSGGYIVINSTEALVAIDVNSGRATRERNIEETATRTNLEAADEIARQLRLRDLAGLIVIDFIDMEENRNNAAVERRLKEAMRHDRARIQVGRISAFGLLELSRQRLRPSLLEASTETCRHCRGTGHVRSTESTALHVLRAIEEEAAKSRGVALTVSVPTIVALYVLNNKRAILADLEARNGVRVMLSGDDVLIPPEFRMDRAKALLAVPEMRAPVSHVETPGDDEEPAEEVHEEEETERSEPAEAGEVEGGRRRSRRRRRGRRDDGSPAHVGEQGRPRHLPANGDAPAAPVQASDEPEEDGDDAAGEAVAREPADRDNGGAEDGGRRRRRRGRRGGRRRRRGNERSDGQSAANGEGGIARLLDDDRDDQGSEQREIAAADASDDLEIGLAPAASASGVLDAVPDDTANGGSGGDSQRGRIRRRRAPADAVVADPIAEPARSRRGQWRDAAQEADPETIDTLVESPPAAPPVDLPDGEPISAPPPVSVHAPEPAARDTEGSGPPKRGWWKRLVE